MNHSKTAILPTITETLQGVVVVLSFVFIVLVLFIVSSRLFYPYQLEWMEGAGLVQVSRILAGKTLYVPPSVDFVPLIYPPLYFYFSALVAEVIGLGFGALRLVSFLSSVLCAAIIFLAVKEKTNSRFAAVLGAGSFASTFMLTGQWLDIARTDMLAAGLSMLGIFLARETEENIVATFCSGIVFALAFLTKQSALIVGLAAVAYYLLFNRRRAVALMLSFGLSLFILYGIFWLNSAGWINYYLFTIPAAHAFDISLGRIFSVLLSQFGSVPIFLVVGLLPMLVTPGRLLQDGPYRYYAALAGALIVTGIVGRLNAFSGSNVYVSSYLGIALLIGLETGWLIQFAKQTNLHPILILVEWIFLSAQFAILSPAYFQTKTIPTQQDRAAGDALVDKIRSYQGDVLLLDNNYLALYASKKPYFNEMPMSEISGQGNLYPMPQWKGLEPQIKDLIHAPGTAAIMVDFALPIKSMIVDCRQQPISYADKIVFEPVAGPPNSRPSLIITCH